PPRQPGQQRLGLLEPPRRPRRLGVFPQPFRVVPPIEPGAAGRPARQRKPAHQGDHPGDPKATAWRWRPDGPRRIVRSIRLPVSPEHVSPGSLARPYITAASRNTAPRESGITFGRTRLRPSLGDASPDADSDGASLPHSDADAIGDAGLAGSSASRESSTPLPRCAVLGISWAR